MKKIDKKNNYENKMIASNTIPNSAPTKAPFIKLSTNDNITAPFNLFIKVL